MGCLTNASGYISIELVLLEILSGELNWHPEKNTFKNTSVVMVHRNSTVQKIKKSFLYYVSFCHSFKWKRTIKYLRKSARKEWRQKIFQTWQNVHFRANLSKILNWYCSFIQFSEKWFRAYVSDTAWKVSKYGVFSGPYLDTFHTVCRKICGIGLNDYYL